MPKSVEEEYSRDFPDKNLYRNISIHISDRNHMNLTMNIYNCGNQDLTVEREEHQDYYKLYYVTGGKGIVTQRQAAHRVEAGQGFVVFPNENCVIRSDHKELLNVTWVAFSGYLVDRYLMRARLSPYEPVFSDIEDRELAGYFEHLLEVSTRLPNRYCKLMAELYSIFGFLLDHTEKEPQPVSDSPELYLMKALDFIDTNYQADLRVEDIADFCGINRKALYTVFKNLTGFSPRDYLICYRMAKSAALVKDPSLSIEMVASSVGYKDPFHFSKEFKKNVGISPSEYRRAVAEDPSKEYQSPIDGVRIQFPAIESYDVPPKF